MNDLVPDDAGRQSAAANTALNEKERAIVELMTYGRPDDPKCEPLTLAEAAEHTGYRQKRARALAQTPLFQAALKREIIALRDCEGPRSLRTIISIRDDEGAGTAADKKVRLQAAQSLLPDEFNKPSVAVNVSVGVKAGYVIDLRPGIDRRPLPANATPGGAGGVIIDAAAIEE